MTAAQWLYVALVALVSILFGGWCGVQQERAHWKNRPWKWNRQPPNFSYVPGDPLPITGMAPVIGALDSVAHALSLYVWSPAQALDMVRMARIQLDHVQALAERTPESGRRRAQSMAELARRMHSKHPPPPEPPPVRCVHESRPTCNCKPESE